MELVAVIELAERLRCNQETVLNQNQVGTYTVICTNSAGFTLVLVRSPLYGQRSPGGGSLFQEPWVKGTPFLVAWQCEPEPRILLG